jgi:hypothetical protein
MSIVSSETIIDAAAQVGGGHYVLERHTDSNGVIHQIGPYLAPVGFDTTARLAAQATALANTLADGEAQELLNG